MEARKLTLGELRDIVNDPSELAKGTRVFDEKGLAHLSRFENKLFADAAGSGASPYKVQIIFEEKSLRGRCSCMAARSRPFCKHAAALLVAWARAPESFAEASAPPEGTAGGTAKKKEIKKGKVDAKDFMARGVEQVSTLVRELAVAGVASMAADRVEQVRALGEGLREAKLRRVSARTIELSNHLAKAATRSDAFDASEYTELVADLLLTARKLEKHIAGEPLADEHVEELIGKTWTKKDRKPVSGLHLVEVSFATRVTPDDFVIRESRFVDVASGEHYSEKQILPGFLAKRTEAKKSWAGRVLVDASGSLYPTYAPKRIDLEEPQTESLHSSALEQLRDKALPSVSAALAALQERRKDVFAPETMPASVRVDRLLAEGARLQVVDESGAALFLPDEADVEDALVRALRGARLEVLVGDVALDGALPTFFPLAAVLREGDALSLVSLGNVDAAARLESKKVRAKAEVRTRRASWVDVARKVGAGAAAIALGEVRDEMASALATGLPSVNARFADPLASRLRDLGLGKQADLLSTIASKQDPAEKLDDFIKLHQVLGIALTRLAGATHVDRTALVPVPTYESVHVREPAENLEPREVARRQGAGSMNRWEAALHYARHYDAQPVEALSESIYPTWADGSAAPFIARAFAKAPDAAIAAARKVLEHKNDHHDYNAYRWYRRVSARMAKLTAIRVLAAAGTAEARKVLFGVASSTEDRQATDWLRPHIRRAILALDKQPLADETQQNVANLVRLALSGSSKDDRIHALETLAKVGATEAIPAMRASFLGDVVADVREAAAFALARVGDVDSVDTFVRMIRQRNEDPQAAKTAAYALGILGDVRGMDALLEAYGDGWQPGIVAEALREIGGAALEPMVSLIETRPEIAERKAALGFVSTLPADDVSSLLIARLESLVDSPEFVARATLYATIAAANPFAAKDVAKKIRDLRPNAFDKKKSTTEEKALARKCSKHL